MDLYRAHVLICGGTGFFETGSLRKTTGTLRGINRFWQPLLKSMVKRMKQKKNTLFCVFFILITSID